VSNDVGQIVVIDSQSWTPCAVCGESVASMSSSDEMHNFEERVNHLLSEHDASLQHVGQHTGRSHDGDLFQHVVAVLGLPRVEDDSPADDEDVKIY
jgi:acyl-ACP thioesterase